MADAEREMQEAALAAMVQMAGDDLPESVGMAVGQIIVTGKALVDRLQVKGEITQEDAMVVLAFTRAVIQLAATAARDELRQANPDAGNDAVGWPEG